MNRQEIASQGTYAAFELFSGTLMPLGLFLRYGQQRLEEYALQQQILHPDVQTVVNMYTSDIRLAIGTVLGIVVSGVLYGDGMRRIASIKHSSK